MNQRVVSRLSRVELSWRGSGARLSLLLWGCLVSVLNVCAATREVFPWKPDWPKSVLTEWNLVDRTDRRPKDLVITRELAFPTSGVTEVTCQMLDVYDPAREVGVAFVRLAPVVESRWDRTCDFRLHPDGTIVCSASVYPLEIVPYNCGRIGRIKALHAFQRRLRPYHLGLDGLALANTWGDRSRDTAIREDFLLKEVEAVADLGLDALQIADGWQTGRTQNSGMRRAGEKGAWNGFWSIPGFWDVDRERLPRALAPIREAAAVRGLKLGLWYAPDSSDEAVNWARDLARIREMNTRDGVTFVKIGGMECHTAKTAERQYELFETVARELGGKMAIDIDVTAGIRPFGYLGMVKTGAIFVENRYTDHRSYWPHETLRALWSLAQVIDPVHLRMEFLNPRRNVAKYGDHPLAPAKWPEDALFAIVMPASPLAWMEVQNVHPDTIRAWKPLIAVWRIERERFHRGALIPIGGMPDGKAWTGFASVSDDGTGSVLVFRERNVVGSWLLDLEGLFTRIDGVRVIYGRGEGKLIEGGAKLLVSVPGELDFVWLRLMRGTSAAGAGEKPGGKGK